MLKYYITKLFFQIKKRAPSLKKLHLESFPAIHFKHMDWMDFVLKFSSELLVIFLAVTVAGFNLVFFSAPSGFVDLSLAGNFLSHHASLNTKLYEKNMSIVTVVTGKGLLPQAQAEDFSGLDSQNLASDSTSDQTGSVINSGDNGIDAPNPDSIKGLVANVIKNVYTTKPGDSLKSIAAANGISINSIKWSNPSLAGDIKPGLDLLIPPADGVAVVADNNTTLPDLAIKFNPERYNSNKKIRDDAAAKLLETIISYNGLDSAEDINAGDFIFIPSGVQATPPAPKPTPKPAPRAKNTPADNGVNTITSVSDGYDAENHTFPKGYCTYYVASQMKITFGGNAKNWLANAKASGYVTGQEPAAHSAVVMTGPKGAMRRYGHVAYVNSVNGDGTITVAEMNYDHFNRIDTRTISIHDSSIRGYIYP